MKTSLSKTLLYHKKSTRSRRITKVKPFWSWSKKNNKSILEQAFEYHRDKFQVKGPPGCLFAGAPLKTQEHALAAKLGVNIVCASLKHELNILVRECWPGYFSVWSMCLDVIHMEFIYISLSTSQIYPLTKRDTISIRPRLLGRWKMQCCQSFPFCKAPCSNTCAVIIF